MKTFKSIFIFFISFYGFSQNGSVITWGPDYKGGNSSSVASELSSNVLKVYSTNSLDSSFDAAFAALKTDGSVITWGDSTNGGDSSSVSSDLSSGVIEIFSTYGAFAALKNDGSVVTWGVGSGGGDTAEPYEMQLTSGWGGAFNAPLTSEVTKIFSTGSAFAALKSDGSVITWGGRNTGGNSSSVASDISSGVSKIFSNSYAFAALKDNGSVITWGGSTT